MYSCCHLRKQDIVPNVIEVGLQIHVQHPGFVLHNGLSYSVNRLMSGPLRAIAIGPLLEVRLEDGFQDQLERPLDHTVPDGQDR